MSFLKNWMDRLGVSTKVLLKKYNKRIMISLASITCINMNKEHIQPKVYIKSDLLAEALTGCGCRYLITHDYCGADIVLADANQCGRPVFTLHRQGKSAEGYDVVSYKPTVVPGRYLLEVNNTGFLVEIRGCSIKPATLTPKERVFLEILKPYMEEYGYLDVKDAVTILSTRYGVTKNKARQILIENSERGLISLNGRRVFIPFYEEA